MERPRQQVLARRQSSGPFKVIVDHRVQLGVQGLYAGDALVHELSRADVAHLHRVSLANSVEIKGVRHEQGG